jgi:1,2-phenylacetyl-CoA epoxidase PaaB subunit
VFVWDVLGKRREDDEFVVVGGVKAPDEDLALLLAKETHFRHKEGVEYAVRRRGQDRLHHGPYRGDLLGGLTDRSYRTQRAYAGVGAKLKRVAEEAARRGLRIDRPRPPQAGRLPAGKERTERDRSQARPGGELTPEDLAAQGTAG